MKIEKLVTVVMTTMNNFDFTRAATWALRKRYGNDLRIIYADGGSDFDNYTRLIELGSRNVEHNTVMQLMHECAEDCRNAAAALVETEFVLFMDNDTKVLGDEAIPILLDAVQSLQVAQTGAYGLKIIDREKRSAYVGTDFTANMKVDAMPCYFSLHRIRWFREIGGFPKEWFYDIPEELWKDKWQPGYSGDLTITRKYNANGLKAMTPSQRVPILHWGQSYRANTSDPVNDFWYKNVRHIRCNPLNDWEHMSKEQGDA